MNCDREAFDLTHKACRKHFMKHAFKYGRWNELWWLKLVVKDTFGRVCSKPRQGK